VVGLVWKGFRMRWRSGRACGGKLLDLKVELLYESGLTFDVPAPASHIEISP
jgi:hypothetical protein